MNNIFNVNMLDVTSLNEASDGLASQLPKNQIESRTLDVDSTFNSKPSQKHGNLLQFTNSNNMNLKLQAKRLKKETRMSKKNPPLLGKEEDKFGSLECKLKEGLKTNKKQTNKDGEKNFDKKKVENEECTTERESSTGEKVACTMRSRKKSRSKNFVKNKKEKKLFKMQQEQQKIQEKLHKNKEMYNYLMKQKTQIITADSFCTGNGGLMDKNSASDADSVINEPNGKNPVKNKKLSTRPKDIFQDLSESTIITEPCDRKSRGLVLQDKRKKTEELEQTILEKNKKMFNFSKRVKK